MTHAAPLTISNLVCRFGTTRVVDEVSIEIAPGEHVAIIGSNGSGKTTLLRAILGLHPIYAGQIVVDHVHAQSTADWRQRQQRIAWMPQRQATGQFPLLVHELLASSRNPTVAHDIASQLEVGMLADRPLHALSGGQLQRVFLARALGSIAGGAGLLLADEPTAALDFGGQAAVATVIAAQHVTVLVVTHDRTMASHCGRVIEMANGRAREVTP
jgi:zinc transport system ATP-binding protein